MKPELIYRILSKSSTNSEYDWINIEYGDKRVGKIRCAINDKVICIYSINIFPEFERRGFAKNMIEFFKNSFDIIVADRVRPTAIGFWEKMNFHPDGTMNFIWEKKLA